MNPSSNGQNPGSVSTSYGRNDLQAAFNWLVHQPDQIRKQATDPDRLMTLFYRSSNSPANSLANSPAATPLRDQRMAEMRSDAPVSSQNFISDLQQINEAMRQFDGPRPQPAHPVVPATAAPIAGSAAAPIIESTGNAVVSGLHPRTVAIISDVRERLNLSNDAEAINVLVALAQKHLRSLFG